MHLADPAAIRLGDGCLIIVNPDLLSLLRQMPKQMGDVTANGAHVGTLQFQAGKITQLVEAKRAIYGELIVVDLPKLGLLRIELVLDIAHDFFKDVFERHHADGAAIFVYHDGEMSM